MRRTYWYLRRWGFAAMLRRLLFELRQGLHPERESCAADKGSALLVNLATVDPFAGARPKGRIAVHLHAGQSDALEGLAAELVQIPFPFDLFVSTDDEPTRRHCEGVFQSLNRMERLETRVSLKHGGDLAPLFCLFGKKLSRYEFLAHIHTAQTLPGATDNPQWIEYLRRQLLGSEGQVRRILALFARDSRLGMVYPQNPPQFPYWGNTWLDAKDRGRAGCQWLGIEAIPQGYFDFPATSLFWARPAALGRLFEAGKRFPDLPATRKPAEDWLTDGTERLLVLTTRQAGFRTVVLADPRSPSWSKWRFDQYLARTPESVQGLLRGDQIQAVAFDVFGALLLGPSLSSELIPAIVALRMADRGGAADFIRLRALAEDAARARTGRQPRLDEIYAEYSRLTDLSPEDAPRFELCEQQIVAGLVSPRSQGLALYREALAAGKRVVLIADGSLTRSAIEGILEAKGITGYSDLYLPSETGVGKEGGQLYGHILARLRLPPQGLLMVGDDEYGDVQIPLELGAQTCHLMRPLDLARATPRFAKILDSYLHRDRNSELVLGLISRRFFNPAFYSDFSAADLIRGGAEGVGYGILGPIVVAFTDWLLERTRADGISALYFLSREGKLLKEVYERMASGAEGAPEAHYLVLSRRAMTVPLIETFDDILAIARSDYFSTGVGEFLFYRYGLQIEADEMARAGLWRKDAEVEVKGDDPSNLQPLLTALRDRIEARAALERPGLRAYVHQMGLDQVFRTALVDVGYTATIQAQISKLLGNAIHGYYLLTSARAKPLGALKGALIRGCFGESLLPGVDRSPLWRHSFELEMLLGTDDPQVMYYETQSDGGAAPVFQPLSPQEQVCTTVRADIRRGVLAFVEDFLALRHEVHPQLSAPREVAATLFEEFVERMSSTERASLSALASDDHYCGRGTITF